MTRAAIGSSLGTSNPHGSEIADYLNAVFRGFSWLFGDDVSSSDPKTPLGVFKYDSGTQRLSVTLQDLPTDTGLIDVARSLVRHLMDIGLCHKGTDRYATVDPQTGELTLPDRAFRSDSILKVQQAIAARDALNSLSLVCGHQIKWRINADISQGVTLEAPHLKSNSNYSNVGFAHGQKSGEADTTNENVFKSAIINQASLLQGRVAADLLAVGVIRSADSLSSLIVETDRTEGAPTEFASFLKLPMTAIDGLSGVIGYVAKKASVKAAHDTLLASVPLIEQHIATCLTPTGSEMTLVLATLQIVTVDGESSPPFRVVVQAMTPSDPSLRLQLFFKDAEQQAAVKQGLVQATFPEPTNLDSTDGNFPFALEIRECESLLFRDALAFVLIAQLEGAWAPKAL